MSTFLTGATRDRVAGRFTEWSCRTVCWKRCTTRMRRRFSLNLKDLTDMLTLAFAVSNRFPLRWMNIFLLACVLCVALAGCEKANESTQKAIPAESVINVKV